MTPLDRINLYTAYRHGLITYEEYTRLLKERDEFLRRFAEAMKETGNAS